MNSPGKASLRVAFNASQKRCSNQASNDRDQYVSYLNLVSRLSFLLKGKENGNPDTPVLVLLGCFFSFIQICWPHRATILKTPYFKGLSSVGRGLKSAARRAFVPLMCAFSPLARCLPLGFCSDSGSVPVAYSSPMTHS